MKPSKAVLILATCLLSLLRAHGGESEYLLKVNSVDKDGHVMVTSVKYTRSMTLSALRASTPPDSPLKWAAFCKNRSAGLSVPFYPLDYEADDLERVSTYFSPDDEVKAFYMFVIKDEAELITVPICPFSTFSQLRDRLGHLLDTRDFTFQIDNLDEEKAVLRTYVQLAKIQSVTPGANLKNQYANMEAIRSRAVHISSGGVGIQRVQGPADETVVDFVMKKIRTEPVAEKPVRKVTIGMTLSDESIIMLTNVDINRTTVAGLRELLAKKMDERQREANYDKTLAICSPYTEAELNETDLLADHVVVSSTDTVTFSTMFMSLIDWPSGKDTPVVVTACPRSTFKQVITRAAPSHQKHKSATIYAVPDNRLLTSQVPKKHMTPHLSRATDCPLHIRFSDSIFVKIQDGEGYRTVMVQDKNHLYRVQTVRTRFEELLGKTHGWSLAICAPREHPLGAVELPTSASLTEHGLADDGKVLDAMVIRVKVTVEAKKRTTELLMNVCAASTIADLEVRIKMAVEADTNDDVYFMHNRLAESVMDKTDIDLSCYRTRPPVHPTRTLYVWIGKVPFFTLSRLNHNDNYVGHINIIYTLPDETVQVFNHVDPNMPIKELRALIKARLSGDLLTANAHANMALCSDLNIPMEDSKAVGHYMHLGDNILGVNWITLLDWASSSEPTVVTACAGETYRQMLTRIAPSMSKVADAKNYQLMDGSSLDTTIHQSYLADESGKWAKDTLRVRLRDERFVNVPGADGKLIAVSVPITARVKDLRAELAKKIGPAAAWGIGFCAAPSLSGFLKNPLQGPGELPEDAKLREACGTTDGFTFKNNGHKVVVLKHNNVISRVPVTVCSNRDEEVSERLRMAVGAGKEDLVFVESDERSPLVKYLPAWYRRPHIIHMSIIKKDSAQPKGDADKKDDGAATAQSRNGSAAALTGEPGASSGLLTQRNRNLAIAGFMFIIISIFVTFVVYYDPSKPKRPEPLANADANADTATATATDTDTEAFGAAPIHTMPFDTTVQDSVESSPNEQ